MDYRFSGQFDWKQIPNLPAPTGKRAAMNETEDKTMEKWLSVMTINNGEMYNRVTRAETITG